MTEAQKKAEELIQKFYTLSSGGDEGGWMTKEDAKQCACRA